MTNQCYTCRWECDRNLGNKRRVNRKLEGFKAFCCVVSCCVDVVGCLRAEGCWVLLFSRGREREGMIPYGDLRCPKQLNTLPLFCSLLVVSATELAQTERKRERNGERQRWISTACSCLLQCLHHFKFLLTICHCVCGILWKLEVRGVGILKRGCRTISGYQKNAKKKKIYFLFTDY